MVPGPLFFHFVPLFNFFIAFILFLKTFLFQNIKIQENQGSRFKIKGKVLLVNRINHCFNTKKPLKRPDDFIKKRTEFKTIVKQL